MKRYGEEFSFNDNEALWNTVTSYMDDSIRLNLNEDMAPCEPDDFLAAYLRHDPEFTDLLRSELDITDIEITDPIDAEVLEVAKQIRECDTWDPDLNHKLCELAGLEAEYDAADGESFEEIVFRAADILGVYII